MTTNIIPLYETLRKNLGDQAAGNIAAFVDANMNRCKERDLEIFASKLDLNNVKLELKQDLNDLKVEFKQDVTDLKLDISSISEKISDTKTDVARWIFAIFITVALAFMGLYLKK